MFASLTATIEVARPHNMIVAAACAGAGYSLAGGRIPSEIALPLVFTALAVALGNLINDYYDADIDRVNKPRRPIPSGRLSAGHVRSLYLIGSVLVTAGAFFFVPIGLATLILLWELLLFLYGWKAKRLVLVGNLLVSSVASSAFVLGAMVAGNLRAVLFPVVFAFLFNMGRELVKGAEDVEGDRAVGAITLPIRIGVEQTVLIAVCFLLSCAVIAPVPVLLGRYGNYYIFLMEIFVVPGLLVASYLILWRPRKVILNRVSWILKIEMFFGIAAMGLGKV